MTRPIAWYFTHCGNCPGGGVHQPQFCEGEIVILCNEPDRGEVVTLGKETFPHYFDVVGKTANYCETCFDKLTVWQQRIMALVQQVHAQHRDKRKRCVPDCPLCQVERAEQ